MKKANIIKTSVILASLLATMSIYADTTMTTTWETTTISDSGTTVTTEENSTDSSSGQTTVTTDENNEDKDSNEDTVTVSSWSTASWTISPETIKKNREQIQANWSQFHDEYGFIKQFLAKPALKEDIKKLETELKGVLKSYHEVVKALIKEWQNAIKNNTFDKEVFNTKATEIFTKHVETLGTYVDPAKMEAFKKFMEAKRATILVNKELRINNVELRKDMKDKMQDMKWKVQDMKAKMPMKKSLVSESLKNKLFSIIDKIPAEKRTEIINKVITRIDTLVAKTTQENKKQLLIELKQLLQSKLNNTQTEDEILNEIIPAE